MADTPVTAEDYYKQHAAEEREYVRVYVARPAKEGDHIVVNAGGLNIQSTLDEDGYMIVAYTGRDKSKEAFLNADEFKEMTADAGKLTLPVLRVDMAEKDLAKLTPVKKGKQYVTAGLPIMTRAECDGFLYKDSPADNGATFFPNYSVMTSFNYAGKKFETQPEQVVTLKHEEPLKGFILGEAVTFAFKSGPYEAEQGSFIYVNPADEDGYTVHPPGFAAFGLRRNMSDEQLAAMSDVSLKEAVEIKGPLKFKKNP